MFDSLIKLMQSLDGLVEYAYAYIVCGVIVSMLFQEYKDVNYYDAENLLATVFWPTVLISIIVRKMFSVSKYLVALLSKPIDLIRRYRRN
jgi:hypothetical protein